MIKDRKIGLVKSLKIVRPADGLHRGYWTSRVAELTVRQAVMDAFVKWGFEAVQEGRSKWKSREIRLKEIEVKAKAGSGC